MTLERAQPARPPSPASRSPGHAALLAVQLCYGLFPLFTIRAVESFAPRAIASWRMLVGASVLGGLALALHGRRAVPSARDLPRLAACSLCGVVLNQVLAIEGMARTSSTRAGLLMTLIPVFTFGLAALVGQERLSARRALGLGVALAGALVVLLARSGVPVDARHGSQLAGNLMIAANCLSYSIYLIVSRPLLARYPALVLTALVYAGSLACVPFLSHGQTLVPAAPSASALAAMAYILVFPTLVAYFLSAFALARVAASTTAVYIYLQPLVAACAGILVLRERLRPEIVRAAGLLFVGIWLVSRRGR